MACSPRNPYPACIYHNESHSLNLYDSTVEVGVDTAVGICKLHACMHMSVYHACRAYAVHTRNPLCVLPPPRLTTEGPRHRSKTS